MCWAEKGISGCRAAVWNPRCYPRGVKQHRDGWCGFTRCKIRVHHMHPAQHLWLVNLGTRLKHGFDSRTNLGPTPADITKWLDLKPTDTEVLSGVCVVCVVWCRSRINFFYVLNDSLILSFFSTFRGCETATGGDGTSFTVFLDSLSTILKTSQTFTQNETPLKKNLSK
jgi:hypothetical protein